MTPAFSLAYILQLQTDFGTTATGVTFWATLGVPAAVMGGRSTPFTTPRSGTRHARVLRRDVIEAVKTTGYFDRSVMSRPDRKSVRREWCMGVLDEPEQTEVESNGRTRHWAYVAEAGKYLRVITLEDGETVHNAMFDRSYARRRRREK